MARKTLVTTNPLYWMPLNLDEWLNEIGGGLRPEQKGALIDLLATAWKQIPPCTLPHDPTYLAARSGLGASWKKLSKPILKHFVAVQGDRLQCPWLLELYKVQLQKYEERRQVNIENRAKRGQHEIFDGSGNGTSGGTPRSTSRTTRGSTNGGTRGGTSAPQSIEREGVSVPTGQRDTPQSNASGAPAPEGARADEAAVQGVRQGGGPTRITDILRLANVGVPR